MKHVVFNKYACKTGATYLWGVHIWHVNLTKQLFEACCLARSLFLLTLPHFGYHLNLSNIVLQTIHSWLSPPKLGNCITRKKKKNVDLIDQRECKPVNLRRSWVPMIVLAYFSFLSGGGPLEEEEQDKTYTVGFERSSVSCLGGRKRY